MVEDVVNYALELCRPRACSLWYYASRPPCLLAGLLTNDDAARLRNVSVLAGLSRKMRVAEMDERSEAGNFVKTFLWGKYQWVRSSLLVPKVQEKRYECLK